MAETADILANRPEQVGRRGGQRVTVVLPDLAAGCSMADMAAIEQVEDCWEQLAEVIDVEDVTPVTYVNSAASLKAFCGRHGGIVCTSSNARAVLDWSFQRRRRVLFFPDQHLGRNTARTMGIPLERDAALGPAPERLGGNAARRSARSRVLLWKGHCSVHQMFQPQHVAQFRAKYPGIKILVHPECMMEVVEQADVIGSTSRIIRAVEQAPPGTPLGHRHRAAPGQSAEARASRAGDPLPLADGLHVRDDVSHRPAAPLLGAGEPGRRHAGERGAGRRGNGPLRPGGAAADAGGGAEKDEGGRMKAERRLSFRLHPSAFILHPSAFILSGLVRRRAAAMAQLHVLAEVVLRAPSGLFSTSSGRP